jgi:adenylylsulfate reductase subunit A
MVTREAFQDPHKEVVGWENFLGMTIGQAVVWASQNIDPKHINPELTTSEPYVMGSHATCSGAWASGRKTTLPTSISGGYNRMMTVEGLFGAGTPSAARPQVLVGLLHRRAHRGQGGVRYVKDMKNDQPAGERAGVQGARETIYQPLENFPHRPQRDHRRHRLAELSCCPSTVCSGWRRSWTSTPAASARCT